MDEPEDQPTHDDLRDKLTDWPVDRPTEQVPQQSGADVLNEVRDAFERLGKEVLSTAEDVSSGRRAVLPDGVRSSLADLVSGLAAAAEGAARSLGEWSRKLESESESGSESGSGSDPQPGSGSTGAGEDSPPS